MELSEQLVKLKGDLDFHDVLDVLVYMRTTVHIQYMYSLQYNVIYKIHIIVGVGKIFFMYFEVSYAHQGCIYLIKQISNSKIILICLFSA